jgi:hypothetical protein
MVRDVKHKLASLQESHLKHSAYLELGSELLNILIVETKKIKNID